MRSLPVNPSPTTPDSAVSSSATRSTPEEAGGVSETRATYGVPERVIHDGAEFTHTTAMTPDQQPRHGDVVDVLWFYGMDIQRFQPAAAVTANIAGELLADVNVLRWAPDSPHSLRGWGTWNNCHVRVVHRAGQSTRGGADG